ncbi:MAG: glycosyltransferase [Candidatus Moraniibacteriota bacterium]
MLEIKDLKIALVHDFLIDFGGAERVLRALCEMFPEAPIYTLLAEKENFPTWLQGKKIETSFLQKWPKFLLRRKKWLLPLMPMAPETFDLREFDLVISSSGAWSKGIVTRLNTVHISYLHSPMRFVWDSSSSYLREQKKNSLINFFVGLVKNYLRVWDRAASDRPDYLIVNSNYTKERVRKYYGRGAQIIYPPVSIRENIAARSVKNLPKDYFLIVSRLAPYKKVDVAIEAFNKLELPLVIVGTGTEERYLKSIAGKNIQFLGFQSDEKLAMIYAGATGFIFPAVDDFGIAPVEAMLAGVPVLAIRKGGAKEIVKEGITGEFFEAVTPEVLSDGVRRFKENRGNYDVEIIKARAREFSEERFKREMREFIENVYVNHGTSKNNC